MIPATPGPKIPEDGPEPEFRPEFFRNFEPSLDAISNMKHIAFNLICDPEKSHLH
jgi:hypothetical protein